MKRPQAICADVFAGGLSLGLQKYFDVRCHLEESEYGVATARYNFPKIPIHVGVANWPIEQLQKHEWDLIACNPPCFSRDTSIFTESGPIPIKQLVRDRSTSRVWSVNDAGNLVLKHITGWHENPYRGDMYDVRLKYGIAHARSTADHKFLTRRGWVSARNLIRGDEVCTGYTQPNERQRELIDGMMLGDATIKKAQAQFVVSQIHGEYVSLKQFALSPFVCQNGQDEPRNMADGCIRRSMSWFYLKTEAWVKRERVRWYGKNRERIIPRDVRLTPLSLAIWYMDDGARRARTPTETGQMMFCTDRYSLKDIKFLRSRLIDLGIDCKIVTKINRRGGKVIGTYKRITTTSEGTKTLVSMIGKFVPPEMRYKLPSWSPAFEPLLYDLGEPITYWDEVIATKSKSLIVGSLRHVYCLDVEDTHNFATYGGIAHNCAAWSVAGYTKTRGTDKWRTDPRVECTVKCFGLLKSLKPKIWVWESVTQAYTKGEEFVRTLEADAIEQGYSVYYVLHNAAWLGLPQVRKRFFMICSRNDIHFPAPNWSPPPTPLEVLNEVTNVGKPLVEARWTKSMLAKVEPGERLCRFWERNAGPPSKWKRNPNGTVKGRPSYGHYRLPLDRPGGAVVGYNIVHPKQNRFLSSEEMQALCGFPEDFVFVPKGLHAKASEIARGVCPPVGAWLGKILAEAVERGKIHDRPLVTEIDFRDPPLSIDAPSSKRELPVTRPKPVSEPRPEAGQGSGEFIRVLIKTEAYQTEEILKIVRKHFPDSKASPGVVAWNRGKLRKHGSVSSKDWK